MMVPELERGGVPVLVARTRVETTAHARRAGKTTFFRHQAMTARTGAGILVAASLDARAPRSPDPPCPPPRPRLRPIWRLIPPRARAPQLSPAHTLQWFMERKRERERRSVGWLVTAVLLALPPSAAAQNPLVFWVCVLGFLSPPCRPFCGDRSGSVLRRTQLVIKQVFARGHGPKLQNTPSFFGPSARASWRQHLWQQSQPGGPDNLTRSRPAPPSRSLAARVAT
jgi:hypothetical protein